MPSSSNPTAPPPPATDQAVAALEARVLEAQKRAQEQARDARALEEALRRRR